MNAILAAVVEARLGQLERGADHRISDSDLIVLMGVMLKPLLERIERLEEMALRQPAVPT